MYKNATPWKILIADDDADVHEATRLALRGTRYGGRPLAFIDAYSAAETLEKLNENADTAIIFLDVVMEADDAGLSAAVKIREAGFSMVRIIVRTGFPGYAPEREVIVNYDIHDYKEKSELTVQKLFTTTVSALRAYADLVALENNRRSLMSVLESVSWFDFNASKRYIAGMLATFSNLAGLDADQVVMVSRALNFGGTSSRVIATLGDWPMLEMSGCEELPPPVAELVLASLMQGEARGDSQGETLYANAHEIELVIYASGKDAFFNADKVLLDVFMHSVCQALSNQLTFENMLNERNALFHGIALKGEQWDSDADVNLHRMMALATATAQRLQITLVFANEINDRFVRDIGVAASVHDMGNQALPLPLLHKQTVLNEEERSVMQTHVAQGLSLFNQCVAGARNVASVVMAQQVIASHHEHFDGGGYPAGLRGDEIPLAARIVSVVDSFTALTSQRPHRPALSLEDACKLIDAGSGSQFDPRVVQALLTVVTSY